MTKRTPPAPSKRPPATPTPAYQSRAAAIRETIESVAIAFVLAFIFRTFEAEAFVIPTGSMAPTLKGRHKDLECPECHYNFQVSASEEVDRDGKPKENTPLIDRCICPMCRYVWDGEEGPIAKPSYNGDRILVNKFAYQFGDPRRWDVIVFKYPNKSQENYIKRLIGLPNETVRVFRGDIWIKEKDDEEHNRRFEIAKKPPEKLRVMLQPVFDNDLMPTIKQLGKTGWPVRWQPELPLDGNTVGRWTSSDYAAYETDGSAAGETWLRYRHLVPSAIQWERNEKGMSYDADPVKPQLITDFTPYNTGSSSTERRYDPSGLHWVGDLALQCRADVQNDRGQIVLELVKGGRKFQCRIDVGTGLADLAIEGLDKSAFNPKIQTVVKGPGKYELMFANCDRRLFLWVNGQSLPFADYDDLQNDIPTEADLQPVGVASAGVKMKIEHLKIFRDIYYIAMHSQRMYDYASFPQEIDTDNLNYFFSNPNRWKYTDRNKETWNYFDEKNMCYVDYSLQENQFFAMGDNSAKSLDSRSWGAVPRELLIGKAFFVYWPHSWNRIPGTGIPFPFFPNFARMGFVR